MEPGSDGGSSSLPCSWVSHEEAANMHSQDGEVQDVVQQAMLQSFGMKNPPLSPNDDQHERGSLLHCPNGLVYPPALTEHPQQPTPISCKIPVNSTTSPFPTAISICLQQTQPTCCPSDASLQVHNCVENVSTEQLSNENPQTDKHPQVIGSSTLCSPEIFVPYVQPLAQSRTNLVGLEQTDGFGDISAADSSGHVDKTIPSYQPLQVAMTYHDASIAGYEMKSPIEVVPTTHHRASVVQCEPTGPPNPSVPLDGRNAISLPADENPGIPDNLGETFKESLQVTADSTTNPFPQEETMGIKPDKSPNSPTITTSNRTNIADPATASPEINTISIQPSTPTVQVPQIKKEVIDIHDKGPSGLLSIRKRSKIQIIHLGKNNVASSFVLKSKKLRHTLMSRLSELWEKHMLCDLALKANDGQLVPVHRCVIAASSDYFLNLLTPENLTYNETRDIMVMSLPSISYTTLHFIVKFIYEGKITLNVDNLQPMYKAASECKLSELKAACEVLLNELPTNNERKQVSNSDKSGCQSEKEKAVAEGGKPRSHRSEDEGNVKLKPVKIKLKRVDEMEPAELQAASTDKPKRGRKKKISTAKLKTKVNKRLKILSLTSGAMASSKVVSGHMEGAPLKRKRGRPRKHPLPSAEDEVLAVQSKTNGPVGTAHLGTEIEVQDGREDKTVTHHLAFTNTGPQPDFSTLSEQQQQQQQQQHPPVPYIQISEPLTLPTPRTKTSPHTSADEDDGFLSHGSDSEAEEGDVLGQIMQQVLPETPYDWSLPVDWSAHCMVVTDNQDQARKVYSCPQCHKVITKLDNFQDHVRIHTGQKPFLCTVCGIYFRRRKTLKRHEQVHQRATENHAENAESLKPPKQPKRRGRRRKAPADKEKIQDLTDGSADHNSLGKRGRKLPRDCPHCGKVFVKLENLKDHIRIHTGERPFMCTQCGETFRRLKNLRTHERAHRGEKTKAPKEKTKCEICDMLLSSKKGYYAHKRNVHSDRTGYLCQFCGKVLRGRNDHGEHEIACSGQKPFVCSTCGKGFARKRYLDEHAPVHNKEFNYVCPICNKRFTRQDNLRVHKRIHTGTRPYKCIHCGETFRVNCLLKSHMRRYHGAEKISAKNVPDHVKQPRNRYNPNKQEEQQAVYVAFTETDRTAHGMERLTEVDEEGQQVLPVDMTYSHMFTAAQPIWQQAAGEDLYAHQNPLLE